MIIHYFYNFYSFYLYPDILAVFVGRNRVFMRLKYQPIRLVEVTSPLSFPVFAQFMIASWQVTHIFQGVGSIELSKTLLEQFSSCLTKFL